MSKLEAVPAEASLVSSPRDGLTVTSGLVRLRADAIALLVSHSAPDFRTRLLRELVRFAAGVPVWQLNLQINLADERLLRRIRRLQTQVTEALALTELDKKAQNRLSDELAETSERLYAASGQTEPVRKCEGDAE